MLQLLRFWLNDKMSTSRKIQLALGTILLWSSTSVSSFAATNTINPGKFQSDTVKLSVESIPSRQLNLTPDPKLIAGEMRDMLSKIPHVSSTFSIWDEIWNTPTERQKRLFDYCNGQKDFPVQKCFSFLKVWLVEGIETFRNLEDIDEGEKILQAITAMKK